MQATDFKKLFDDEIAKSKANSSSVPQNHMLLRQFREAIWVCFLAGFLKEKDYTDCISYNHCSPNPLTVCSSA